MSAAHPFDLIAHQIEPGFTLVEASAGTGKTYSITWLVIRLIVEYSLTAEQLLIVTFTTAATEELRQRIRAHIIEVLAGWQDASHENSQGELARIYHALNPEQQQKAPLRLQQVLERFEDMSISTIHGFCAQALKEYGHEVGVEAKPVNTHLQPLFDEVVDDYRSLVLSVASLPALRLMRALKKELKIDRDIHLMPICQKIEIGGWAHILSDPLIVPMCDQTDTQSYLEQLSHAYKSIHPQAEDGDEQTPQSHKEYGDLPLFHKTLLDEESSYHLKEQTTETPATLDDHPTLSTQDVVLAWDMIAYHFEHHLHQQVLTVLKQNTLHEDLKEMLRQVNLRAIWNKGGGEEAQEMGWIALQRLQELGMQDLSNTLLIKTLLSLHQDLKTLASREIRSKLNKRKKKDNQDFFDFSHPLSDAIDQMLDLMSQTAISMNAWFRQGFVSYALQEIPMRKAQYGWMSTDDLIHHTHQALQNHPEFTQALRDRYHAALIDEFQDTDPIQWGIFSTIFHPQHVQNPVYLIGDPKQSIYRFRGADLNAYLAVKDATADHRRFTMSRNFRSDPRLLNILNQFFDGRDRALQLNYWQQYPAGTHSEAAGFFEDERVPYVHVDGGRDNRLTDTSAVKWVYFPQEVDLKPQENLIEYVAADVAEFLKKSYLIGSEGKQRVVRVNDIGILVKTNKRARLISAALARRGIPSTVISDQSVYKTQAATHCERLLRGILMPHNDDALRASLSAHFFAMNAQDVTTYSEAIRNLYIHVHQLWVEQGLASAFRYLLYHPQLRLIERVLQQNDGAESLTHLTHLIERLQHTSTHFNLSPELTLQWLRERRLEEGAEVDDEDKVRPYIEEDAVEVVTVHRSKGLEYPILFCPDLWVAPSKNNKTQVTVLEPSYAGAPRSLDIRLQAESPPTPYKDQALKLVDQALVREEKRLLYVALTRAVHHCCLYVSLSNKFYQNPLYKMLMGSDAPTYKTKKEGEALILDHMPNRVSQVLHDVIWEVRYKAASQTPWKTESDLDTQLAVHLHPNRSNHHFSIASFTSLSQQILTQKRITFALAEQPELDETSQSYARAPIPYHGEPPALLKMPRSARFGECVHALLEHIDFAHTSIQDLEKHIYHSFRQWNFPFKLVEDMRRGIWDVLHTPLGKHTDHLRLRDIPWTHRRQEVSFEIALHHDGSLLDAQLLNEILSLDPACEGLPPFPDHFVLQGYLKGSIDVLIQHPHRKPACYFIADYKSNWLGEDDQSTLAHYHPSALHTVMNDHVYLLQSHIYLVVLYRLLKQRLQDEFQPTVNLGASIYLFLRGLAGSQSILPASHTLQVGDLSRGIEQDIAGLYVHKPPHYITALLSLALDHPSQARAQLKHWRETGFI